MMRGTGCLVFVGLLVGCGPDAGSGGSGSQSGSGGSNTDSVSSTSDGTSGGTSDGTGGGTESGSESGSTGGGVECGPAEEVVASFSVTSNAVMFQYMDEPCTVDEVTSTPTSTTVRATCDEGAPGAGEPPTTVTLTWESTGHPEVLLAVGEEVLVTYLSDQIFWVNEWFALKIAGEQPWLIAAGASGSSLDPPDNTFSSFSELLGQPTLTAREGVCEPYAGDCGMQERLVLDLGFDGVTTPVVAPGTGYAGQLVSYHLAAQEASHYLGVLDCTDTPPYWYRLVVESVPEG